MCVCVCVSLCVCLCVCVGGEGVCVCVCCVAAVKGRARLCVCGGGGRGGAGRECVWVGLHVWRVGRDRGRGSQPGKGQRSVCVSGVCVCLWGRGGVWCSLWHVGPCESVLRGGGGGEGWVGVWCIGATRGRVRHMGVCVAAETEAGRPSQAKDNAVCVSGLCVCVWTAVCVCVGGGGMLVVCGQRHRHRVTARQRTTLCVFARVCVCVRAHAYVRVVWAGCLCVGGGVGGGARQCVACL